MYGARLSSERCRLVVRTFQTDFSGVRGAHEEARAQGVSREGLGIEAGVLGPLLDELRDGGGREAAAPDVLAALEAPGHEPFGDACAVEPGAQRLDRAMPLAGGDRDPLAFAFLVALAARDPKGKPRRAAMKTRPQKGLAPRSCSHSLREQVKLNRGSTDRSFPTSFGDRLTRRHPSAGECPVLDRQEAWTLEEFLAWEEKQPRKYELVDGRPRPVAGSTQAHSTIATNLRALLWSGLRGKPCRPVGSDLRIPVPATGNCRYPDAAVDCGEFRPGDYNATRPTVVFKVLSRRDAPEDAIRLHLDYDSVESIRCYVVVLETEPCVSVYERKADHLVLAAVHTCLTDRFILHVVNIELKLSDIYERLFSEAEEMREEV